MRSMIANAGATAYAENMSRQKPTSTIDTFANPCFDEDVDAGSQLPKKRTADKAAPVPESLRTNPHQRHSTPAKRRSSIRNRKPPTQTIQTVRNQVLMLACDFLRAYVPSINLMSNLCSHTEIFKCMMTHVARHMLGAHRL